MLSLSDPSWNDLTHAYGKASDIPALLEKLRSNSSSEGETEPWFSLWSSLAHQGDVYSATFAALPHVIAVLELDPQNADVSFFHFPAWVEICRQDRGTTVPEELATSYFSSLQKLPGLLALAATREWEQDFLPIALSAMAVAKGSWKVAKVALELDVHTSEEFLVWLENR